ncbi:hypothetical protein [Methanosarcina barkeri]|nr:hypothetical protein [Methanosarcina barkeri]
MNLSPNPVSVITNLFKKGLIEKGLTENFSNDEINILTVAG